MNADLYYRSVKFYIGYLDDAKSSVMDTAVDYDPIKADRVINAYKYTLRKIIEHGDLFMLCEKDDWEKLSEVSDITRSFKKFLSKL
jgi:hypothetical protein